MKKRLLWIVSAILFAAGLFLWSRNHSMAILQKNAILVADRKAQDTTVARNDLKVFVSKHMNTTTTFILDGSYGRAAVAAQGTQQPATNGSLYQEAQSACASHSDSITQAHCVTNYLNAHQAVNGAANAAPTTPPPNQADYTYTYVSPKFSWDAAGILLLIGGIGLLIAFINGFRARVKRGR